MNNTVPLKRFGQNFLKDENILKKIVSVTNINNKNIIEIGPGQGALTKYLIKDAKKLTTFEIDKNLIPFLKKTFNDYKNFEVIEGDFLKQDISSFKNYIIISNIPYNITTNILFKIFFHYELFGEVVLLVQKEFAQRVCAQLGDSNYGKLSITSQIFYNCKLVFDVPSIAFYPKPKVTSSVIYLKRKKDVFSECFEFAKFVKNCFSMKRKTLLNNIKSQKLNIEIFKRFCMDNNLSISIRPQQLSYDDYIKLFIVYNK